MRARNISRLRIIVGVTLASAALSAALAQQFDAIRLAGNAAAGGLVGLALSAFEIALQGPLRAALKSLPIGLVFVSRVLVYGAVFRAVPVAVLAAVGALAPAPVANSAGTSSGLGVSLADSFAIALVFNTVFTARALMGPRTLIAFVTGRYHRPRQEERLVLFLDLRGSTGVAERLGDLEFHRFLDRLVSGLADPVADADGEIYRYIGDEIIITWSLARRTAGIAAVACLIEIDDVLSRHRADYTAQFGVVPRLRGALHAGPVVIGEMGQAKREIVMLGNTMNTAARIEEVCRQTGRDYIASAAALRATAPLPAGVRIDALGPMALRGKEEQIELFALTAAPACIEISMTERYDGIGLPAEHQS